MIPCIKIWFDGARVRVPYSPWEVFLFVSHHRQTLNLICMRNTNIYKAKNQQEEKKTPKKVAAKKETATKSNLRKLTVYSKFQNHKYESKIVPEIRLCGEWLRELGFEDGEMVTVSTFPEMLIIKLVS
jgi:toxic protein SymE